MTRSNTEPPPGLETAQRLQASLPEEGGPAPPAREGDAHQQVSIGCGDDAAESGPARGSVIERGAAHPTRRSSNTGPAAAHRQRDHPQSS